MRELPHRERKCCDEGWKMKAVPELLYSIKASEVCKARSSSLYKKHSNGDNYLRYNSRQMTHHHQEIFEYTEKQKAIFKNTIVFWKKNKYE